MEDDNKVARLLQEKLLAGENEFIKDYKLLSTISASSTGTTYKCSKNGNYFALKMVAKANSKLASRQINALSKLKDCSFIIRIVDQFENNGRFCFVTDFFEGISLLNYIRLQKDKRIDPHASLVIFRYLLSAIIEMHKANILHRNIKIENVIINSEGIPKLCGFGLSRELDQDDMTWSLCGTPSYLSPEILLGQPYNYKADVWALGVTLFAMATGQLPFGNHGGKKSQYQKVREICLPSFSFQKVRGSLKYPEKCDFGAESKDWETLFRGLFEERPSKRLSYSQIAVHPIISPVLTADIPDLYKQDFTALDEMLASRQDEQDQRLENESDLMTQATNLTKEIEDEDMEQMVQSKMIACQQHFVVNDSFSKHAQIYKIEMNKYLILADCLGFFKQTRLQSQIPFRDRLLMEFFLEQQMVYFSSWMDHILVQKINVFNLPNFEAFYESNTFKAILKQVQNDYQTHKELLETAYQRLKDYKADEKLPKEIQTGILSYVFIDFNAQTYHDKQPDIYKLPLRSVLLSCFQKIYLKSQRFFSLTEKVEDLMTEGKNDRDCKREFSIKEGISYLKFAMRLLLCSLVTRLFKEQTCILKDIHFEKKNEFDLATFLTSLTLATQRQAQATIQFLFKSFFSQFDLSNLAKEKFM